MSELSRSAFAFGVAASLMAATGAQALDASPKGAAETGATPQAVALVSAGVAAKPADDPSLPKVELAPDGAARKAGGAEAVLGGLARDCANLGAETLCKVALVGESARRRAGGAAAIDAPMTIQVKDGEGHEVATRRINLRVEIPEGVQKVAFRHVEENVSLPPATASGYGGWTIVVGLDPAEPEIASADDGEIEQPSPAPRPKASKRSGGRAKAAATRARATASRATTLQLAGRPQVAEDGLTLTARPLAAPPKVTMTTSGNPMVRAAQSFDERRDAARQAERARAAQPQPAAQPQAAAQVPQPAIRTANR